MYHRVVDDIHARTEYTQPGIMVSTAAFESQMRYLAGACRLYLLSEAVQVIKNGGAFPANAVVVSFDDGWRDNFTNALPILQKHRIPAIIYLTTDFIGSGKLLWFLKAGILLAEGKLPPAELNAACDELIHSNASPILSPPANSLSEADRFIEKFKSHDLATADKILDQLFVRAGLNQSEFVKRGWILTWDDVRTMAKHNMEFGSHGLAHQIMTVLPTDEARRELAQSKKIIEQQLGRPVTSFAYPNGNFSEEVILLVKESRYDDALAIHVGGDGNAPPNLFALPRKGVHEGVSSKPDGSFSRALFACYLADIF